MIPRRSHISFPRKRGHTYRPRSPRNHSRFWYVVDDDPRVVHVADAWTEFGKGLLWSHGEDHKRYIPHLTRSGSRRLTDFTRQRKSLMPGFSIAAIRQLTSIFYDSAYKVRSPSYGSWPWSDMNANLLQRRKELGMSSLSRAAGMALSSTSKIGACAEMAFVPS